ncbi:hypothetical protein Trydic_g17166 [Trypoxylus dichotomus]
MTSPHNVYRNLPAFITGKLQSRSTPEHAALNKFQVRRNSLFWLNEDLQCLPFLTIIIHLSIIQSCCSQHTQYWGDRHTGNRWIVSFWTATPHNQPALDYTELEHYIVPHSVVVDSQKHPFEYSNVEFHHPTEPEVQVQPEVVPAQYIEMKKRESDI